MKNKLVKILGVALTLAFLVGLLMPAMPTSAGTLSWSDNPLPDQFVDGSNITAVAISPDGKTIMVFNNDYEIDKWDDEDEDEEYDEGEEIISWSKAGFAKSTDGGITFDASGLNTDVEDIIENIIINQIVFSPKYSSDKTILAIGGPDLEDEDGILNPDGKVDEGMGEVYWSEDNGKTWDTLTDDETDVENAVSADISYDYNERLNIVVADGTNAWLYNEKGAEWTNLSLEDGYIAGDAYAVKFSSEYEDDGEILAVTSDSETVLLQTCIVAGNDDAEWNTDLQYVNFTEVPGIVSAFINLPSDYSKTGSSAKVFVGLNADPDVDNAGDTDVYRISMSSGNDKEMTKKASEWLNPDGKNFVIYSMDYKGTASEGMLAVGLADDIKVNKEADSSTDEDDWLLSSDYKLPTGNNFSVAFAKDSEDLLVGSQNDPENVQVFGSVFAASTDYKSFDGLSLINVVEANAVVADQIKGLPKETRYCTMKAAGAWMIMRSIDSGKTWKELYAYAQNSSDNSNQIKGYAFSGDTLLIYMKFKLLHMSKDNGATFDDITVRNTDNDNDKQILDCSLSGPDDYYVARPGGEIYKNNGRTAIELPDIGSDEIRLAILIPNFWVIVVSSGPGPTGPVYWSGDNGESFIRTSDKEMNTVTWDIPNKTLYATEDGNVKDLFTFNLETSSDWKKYCSIDIEDIDEDTAADESAIDTIKHLDFSQDAKVLYATVGGNDDFQLIRCVNITESSPTFEAVPGSGAEDLDSKGMTFKMGPPSIAFNAGVYSYWMGADYAAADMPTKDNKIMTKLFSFDDTLVSGPAITSPKANDQIANTGYTFVWDAISSGKKTITYNIQVATDDKFQGKVIDEETEATSFYANASRLVPGKNYFARTKILGVWNDDTLSSTWSAPLAFNVKLGDVVNEGVDWIAPSAGATNVSQTPNFQWAAIPNATGYELVIDGGTAIPLTDTVYSLKTPLAYGTTHTWKVRAISGTNAGDWVSGVFTVMAAPTSTATTTQAPSTTAAKYFDPGSGLYFDTQKQLEDYQAAQIANNAKTPATPTPAYVWVVIIIGAILVISVIVLIARTRRV